MDVGSGRTALVTGASSGIGRVFAERFAERGCDLVLVARRGDVLSDIAADLASRHGVGVRVIDVDLASPAAAADVVARLADHARGIDIVVNNAGLGVHGDVATAPLETVTSQVMVNVVALTELTALLLPELVRRGEGVVVNVASTAAYQPVPHMAVYSATKAYVLAFTRALWSETRGTGVRVLALCPGATETEFFDTAGDAASVGTRRRPEQVVDTALRALAADRPSVVDGRLNALVARVAPRLPERLALSVAERSVRP